MKKNIILIVGLLSALFLFAACGGGSSTDNNDTGDNKAQSSSGDKQEIVVTSFGGQYDDIFTEYVIKPFEEENEGVTVKLAPYTGVAKLNQGGANVDVIQLDDFDLIDAAQKGLLEPIDENNISNWNNLYDQAFLTLDDGETYGL